jgi:hypothetical protein
MTRIMSLRTALGDELSLPSHRLPACPPARLPAARYTAAASRAGSIRTALTLKAAMRA